MSIGPRVRLALSLLFLGGCALPIWVSLGDHPLYGRSDARYATVSATMAATGGWLVPQFEGHPHLTKPPLIYWLEALCIRWLGQDELAVRLPSAVASTLLLAAVFALVHSRSGPRRALLAAGLLSVMPMGVMLGRLTLTDPLLSLAWFGVLACALAAVRQPARRLWSLLLWAAVMIGFLAKGPVILIALAAVALWRLLTADARSLASLRWPVGLPLSTLPLLLWGAAAIWVEPQAVNVWASQVFGRFTAGAAHVKPPWYFLPVFLGGLFPATAMMGLPGFNYRWRQSWRMLCSGSDQSLWTLAVILPLLVFSLSTGKLASYLLPLAAPLAIVTSAHLERWLEQVVPPMGARWPDVRITLLVSVTLGIVGIGLFSAVQLSLWHVLWLPGPAGLALVLGVVVLAVAWRYGPRLRARALLFLWILSIASWMWFVELEDAFLARTSTPAMLKTLADSSPGPRRIFTFGYADQSLHFYGHPESRPLDTLDDLLVVSRSEGQNMLLRAELKDWREWSQRHPAVARSFEPVMQWPVLPLGRPKIVLRPQAPQP